MSADPVEPSDFFQEQLKRLEQLFDLQSYEESKKLLIDAICEEALITIDLLKIKIWKGAQLESDILAGYVDYVTLLHLSSSRCRLLGLSKERVELPSGVAPLPAF